MADRYLEENRFLYINSSLGADELLLESFTGEEAISRLFSFQLELWSENAGIKFENVLGQGISFGVVGLEGGEPRHINGIVTSFTQLPGTFRLARYRATVAPKIWVLTRTQNLRIFQDKDVPDILKQVLQGFDVTWELHKSYPKREYCVQYRETDFNFISRLMEEEGIFYFFRHTASGHKLVIADDAVSHQDIPGDPSPDLRRSGRRHARRFAHHGVDEDPGTGLRQEHASRTTTTASPCSTCWCRSRLWTACKSAKSLTN